MKIILTGLITLTSYFGITFSCIWAMVEFLLYLVKDKPFNWWSVWSILICIVVVFLGSILTLFLAAKEEHDTKISEKSSFQIKIEEMQAKRNKQSN